MSVALFILFRDKIWVSYYDYYFRNEESYWRASTWHVKKNVAAKKSWILRISNLSHCIFSLYANNSFTAQITSPQKNYMYFLIYHDKHWRERCLQTMSQAFDVKGRSLWPQNGLFSSDVTRTSSDDMNNSDLLLIYIWNLQSFF